MTEPVMELFAVRNSAGQWLRSQGYGGGGKTWVDNLSKARIYSAISPARARVTFFANNYPDWPVPDLVRLVVTRAETVDDSARVDAAVGKLQRERDEREVKQGRLDLKKAKANLERAQQRLAEVRAKQ